MKYGSVCSGIESATLAWHPLGWQPAFYSEIEPYCCETLQHYYPDVPNLGDMTQFKNWPEYAIDLLVGGTPCQAFSVAGLRAGLDDPRGNLMLTYLAIAERYRPRWLVWENVPGVLSTDGGRPFGTLLGGMAKLGYGFAYRVLDAQFVRVESHPRAVPQRRRRVFVVGCLSGDWRRAAAVLFEPDSLLGHSAPCRKTKEAVAGCLSASAGKRGGVGEGERGSLVTESSAPTLDGRSGRSGGNNFATSGGLIPEVSGPFGATCSANGGGFRTDLETAGAYIPEVANCLQERDAKGADSDTKAGHILPVAPTLRAGGNETGGDRPPGTDVDTCESLIPVVADPLCTKEGKTYTQEGSGNFRTRNVMAFRAAGQDGCDPQNVSPPITATSGGGAGVPTVAFDETQITNPDNRSNPKEGDPCHTLAGSARPPTIAFSSKGAGQDVREDVSPSLCAGNHAGGNANGGTMPAIVAPGWRVRRLLPIECERLQGMPDGYTAIPRGKRGKVAKDGPRYRALGNSKAVNVVVWLGKRIKLMEELLPPR